MLETVSYKLTKKFRNNCRDKSVEVVQIPHLLSKKELFLEIMGLKFVIYLIFLQRPLLFPEVLGLLSFRLETRL